MKLRTFFKSSSSRYFIFLLWILHLFVCGLFLFTKGFLQDRYILNKKATCTVSDSCIVNNGSRSQNLQNNTFRQFCPTKNKTKGIIIVIDALRYDFVKFTSNTSQAESFHNNLKIVDEVSPKNSRLYKFIAHPPTTTYQRLHGLTTGGLPTFVDIGNNFGSTNIKDDNLIDQFKSHGMKVVLMGDDTWTRIYPDGFHRIFEFPSFNVWDLDSVDEGVKERLFPEMKKTDWDVIIAHFLGVDHCGHSYGPRHPEMARKLAEMNEVLRKVVDKIDDSTVLFVLGDHGMTDSGEHAGDSIDEVSSALFVYSKNEDVISRFLEDGEVYQIDLVPTVANIFGIPIPFSSLGATLLVNLTENRNCSLLDLWSNVNQVTHYITEYSEVKRFSFPEKERLSLLQSYEQLKSRFESRSSDDKNFVSDVRGYLKRVREMCQKVWVQFDLPHMYAGVVITFVTLALGCKFIAMKRKALESVLKGTIYWFVIIASSTIFSMLFLLSHLKIIVKFNLTLAFFCVTCFFSIGILWNLRSNTELLIPKWYRNVKKLNSVTSSLLIVILLLASSSLSNSYIVEEPTVVSFLLTSLLCIVFFNIKPVNIGARNISKKVNLKIFFSSGRGVVLMLVVMAAVLIRSSFLYWRCRYEQVPRCVIGKEVTTLTACVISIFVLASYIIIFKIVLLCFGNLHGSSPVFLLAKYWPLFSVACCGFHWVVSSLPLHVKSLFNPQLYSSCQIAFFSCACSLIAMYIRPLFICLRSEIDNDNDSLTAWVRRKGISNCNNHSTFSGLPTVYSATFINIGAFVLLILSILHGGGRAFAVVLMLTTAFLLAAILSFLKLENTRNMSSPALSWFSALCWALSGSVFFYGTGHQTAFSSIQWESAGIFGDITSTLLPGVLVILNTFASQIFHALFLPLVYILPHTLRGIRPSLVGHHSDSSMGELYMYYNKGSRVHTAFSTMMRYVLFLGFRVFMSMLCALIHMRHLVAWNVFAPKFIFESVGFLISLPFLFIGYFFVERISSQLDYVMKTLKS